MTDQSASPLSPLWEDRIDIYIAPAAIVGVLIWLLGSPPAVWGTAGR